jgi:hypothetical protein
MRNRILIIRCIKKYKLWEFGLHPGFWILDTVNIGESLKYDNITSMIPRLDPLQS